MSTRGSLRQSHVVPLPLVNCLSARAVIGAIAGAIAINMAIQVFMELLRCSSWAAIRGRGVRLRHALSDWR